MQRQRILGMTVAVVLVLTACSGADTAVDDVSTTAFGAEQSTVPETTTTAAPTTTMPPTATTAAPTTTTTQPPPDPQALWDVYTAYFEAATTADWDTAKSLASGVAFEYVELSEELHNVSDQTGWVLQSDTGPGEVVVLDDGTVALGGVVRYLKEDVGTLDPHDPVFDVTGPEPLLTSWGASISADWEDYFAIDDRLLTLGEVSGECGFEPLHAYDPLPVVPSETVLITIEVCPDTAWEPSTVGAVTVIEAAGETGDTLLFRPGQTDPIPGGEPTVILIVINNIEAEALSSPMTISIPLPSGPETFTVPPFRDS